MELLIFFTLLQLADLYTTRRILSSGGKELNPFMARMFEEFGVVPALLLLKSSVVLAAYLYLVPWQFGDLIMGLLCVFYCFVVAHNIHQLQVK